MESTKSIIKNSIVSYIEETKVNRSNMRLMIDKILSYSPNLLNGIEKYKSENHKFTVLILFSIFMIRFPIISLPCCLISMAFLVKMLHLIKYRSIYNIVKNMGRDLAYKGIYNKGKIEDLIDDFRDKYGEDIIEYYELVYMTEKYEAFVVRIESIMKNIHVKTERNAAKEESMNEECKKEQEHNEMSSATEKNNRNKYLDEKYSLLYRNEEGEIKKINRAIEFFDSNSKSEGAVILKSGNKRDKNLTVYLYKKNTDLQNNAL